MTELYVHVPKDGYYFKEAGLLKVESIKGAEYMGFWCTKRSDGSWNEKPVDVFYQPNPNLEAGHSHYFGLFVDPDGRVMITDAASAFSEPMTGVICEDGEVLVSRYRHDCRTKGDRMIDGGRDYVRRSLHPIAVVTVDRNNFITERK